MASRDRNSNIHIAWKTVTYRSVAMGIGVILLLTGAVVNLIFPQATHSGLEAVNGILEKVAGNAGEGDDSSAPVAQQAHFTNFDGTVRVKKANSNTWMSADYSLPLEKGDVVQTGSEGMARIVFNDGTSYTIKEDSLIVIEENSATAQQTQVAVNVTTGTVDLATATYSQGSSSKVIVAGATASLAPESAAMVHNDPRVDEHEILVKKGSGEVARDGQVVHLSDYERVSFHSDSKAMAKTKEIGPPTLIAPANMMPIFSSGKSKNVEFSWTGMANSVAYRLRISKNPYFSSTVYDQRVTGTDVQVPDLGDGAYYWAVQSIDAQGKESIESEKNRFTIIPKGSEAISMRLELDPFIQHGHVIEVRGKTEADARVMVNGREVPLIASDGTFHFFTPPLPNGENVITITAQNARGGVNTQQKTVVIQ
ncbi:MAG TPA: FecR domain-containing protein [Terriglobales bacterium]|nr:FecR domain-containing protein [Terriglobales bacterium]